MKKVPALIAAALCFAAAVFFRFALIGYTYMALVCAGIGICILLYTFLPKWFRIMLTVLLALGLLLFAAGEVPVVRAAGGTSDFDADWLIVLGAGVSGGQGAGEEISEAEAMSRWLTAHGVDPERIVPEPRSVNTLENLSNSFALIPDPHGAQVAVCSSEYHLYRAQYLARQLGYEIGAIPARTSYPVLRLNYFIREGLGNVYYHIFGT